MLRVATARYFWLVALLKEEKLMTSSDNDSIVRFSLCVCVRYRGTVGAYSTLVQSAGVYVSKSE